MTFTLPFRAQATRDAITGEAIGPSMQYTECVSDWSSNTCGRLWKLSTRSIRVVSFGSCGHMWAQYASESSCISDHIGHLSHFHDFTSKGLPKGRFVSTDTQGTHNTHVCSCMNKACAKLMWCAAINVHIIHDM